MRKTVRLSAGPAKRLPAKHRLRFELTLQARTHRQGRKIDTTFQGEVGEGFAVITQMAFSCTSHWKRPQRKAPGGSLPSCRETAVFSIRARNDSILRSSYEAEKVSCPSLVLASFSEMEMHERQHEALDSTDVTQPYERYI